MPDITHEDGTPLTQADADRANAMFCGLPGRARRLLEEVFGDKRETTMYQIKYTSGNEIQVIGKGNNGLARVVGPNGETKFTGGYDDCVAWLTARACKPLSR